MYKSRVLIGFLVLVIVTILLIVGGYALYQLGYSQGVANGLAFPPAEEGAAMLPHQAFPPLRYYGHMGYGGFSRPIFLCFAGSAFLLALFIVLKTIRILTWRSMLGADPEKWHKHWRRHRHGPPGWYGDDEPEPQGSDPDSEGTPENDQAS